MALKVEQEVVQEEVVLAWEVLVFEKEEQIVGDLVAVKQMCRQKEIPLYAVFVIAFLLQNHQNHLHHRPLKIPLLPVLPQGFPDLPFAASWLEEESALSCFSFSSLISQAYLQIVHSDLTFFLHCFLFRYHHGAQIHPLHFLHLICQCHCRQYCHHAYLDPCPQDSRHLHWCWKCHHHDSVEQVRDYITCLRLAVEGEDLGQSPLYGHTFAGLEGEVDREEDQEVSCQGANVERHVQEEEG